VGHYSKLAVLAMRAFGVIILFYAIPMIAYGVLRLAVTTGKPGPPEQASALLGWVVYGIAGGALVLLAQPLGRFVARGLDTSSTPPAI